MTSSGMQAGVQTAPAPHAPAKILVVDDDPENLIALEAVLEGLGEQVVQASSGSEALWKLLDDDFAVILLDVKMPEMDGFETASLIRERERSRHTPIIFLTGLKGEQYLHRGYYVGAVDYLYKPIVPDVLRSKVGVFVELARHKAELERKNKDLEREIAERIRAEDEIRELNLQLEERVMQRTAALQRSNEDLRQFAYAASHDLKEPLRMIGSYTDLLAKRFNAKDDPDVREMVGFVVEGVSRMTALINGMLNYSRVSEVTPVPLDIVKVDAVLDGVLMNLDVAIKQSEATIIREPLPEIRADEIQLMQVLQNLISNAIKYCRAEEPPRIEIKAERTGEEWKFSVKDNGIGIAPQYTERIFGVFKRLHGREIPGIGVGLAICKKIVERHGGQIWVESAPGTGSTFIFTLPA